MEPRLLDPVADHVQLLHERRPEVHEDDVARPEAWDLTEPDDLAVDVHLPQDDGPHAAGRGRPLGGAVVVPVRRAEQHGTAPVGALDEVGIAADLVALRWPRRAFACRGGCGCGSRPRRRAARRTRPPRPGWAGRRGTAKPGMPSAAKASRPARSRVTPSSTVRKTTGSVVSTRVMTGATAGAIGSGVAAVGGWSHTHGALGGGLGLVDPRLADRRDAVAAGAVRSRTTSMAAAVRTATTPPAATATSRRRRRTCGAGAVGAGRISRVFRRHPGRWCTLAFGCRRRGNHGRSGTS